MIQETVSEESILTRSESYLIYISLVLVVPPLMLVYYTWISPSDEVFNTYFQLSFIVLFGTGAYILGMITWLLMFLRGRLYLYQDRIVRQHRFAAPEMFYFTDLLGWDTSFDDKKNLKQITLSFKEKTVIISTTSNLKEFYDYFEKSGLPHYPARKLQNSSIAVLLAVIAVGVSCLGAGPLFHHIAVGIKDANKSTERTTLRMMVTSGKPISYQTRSKGTPGALETYFKSDTYPGLSFVTYNDSVSYYYRDAPSRYNAEHDTVTIDVLKYDYDVKIAHTRQPTFWDRHFDWGVIHIESIKFEAIHFRDFRITTDWRWEDRHSIWAIN